MNNVMGKIYIKQYLLAILIFGLVTIRIFFINQKFGLIEVAFVNYGIGLLLYFIINYLFFIRRDFLIRYWKRIIIILLNVIIVFAISYLLSYFIFNGLDDWKILYRCIFGGFLILCIESVIAFYVKKIHFDIFVGILILSLGSMVTFTLPARNGLGWDDHTHYERALSVSNAFSSCVNGADEMLITSGSDRLTYENMPYNEYVSDLNESYTKNVTTEYQIVWASKRYFIAYIPSAIGLLLGRGMCIPYVLTFLLGRWMNVLVYSILMFLAIRQLKSGKLLLATFALFPTNIFLAGTYSYDYWVIALTVFSICYYLGIIQDNDKNIEYKDMFIIFGTMLLGLIPKITYFPLLMFFILLNPKEKLKDKKHKKIYYAMLSISIVLSVCWLVVPYLVSPSGATDSRGGIDVSAWEQLYYILSSPLEYSKTLLAFLKRYWSIAESIGYVSFWAYLGYTPYHNYTLILLLISVIVDKCEWNKKMGGVLRKLVWLVVAFGISAINATVLYIAFTPVAAQEILGCQPRYILPILFPTLYVLRSYITAEPIKKINRLEIYGLLVLLNAFIVIATVWDKCIVMWAI